MSMIGDAVEGTYDAATGDWKYTSTAGDMEYDANEHCFSLTISTIDENTPPRIISGSLPTMTQTRTGARRTTIFQAIPDLQDIPMMPPIMATTHVWLTIRTTCSSIKRRERMRRASEAQLLIRRISSGIVPQESGG